MSVTRFGDLSGRLRSRYRLDNLGLVGSAVVVAALVVAPGPRESSLDGLPLSSNLERVIALLALVVAVTPQARAKLAPLLRRRFVIAAGIALLTLKLIGFWAPDPTGWAGCYRSPVGSPFPCEVSYENPWGSPDATRYDATIDFGPGRADTAALVEPASFYGALAGPLPSSNWPLQFVNHNRFNLYDKEPGDAHTERLPVFADWRGTIESDRTRRARVIYVGQGTVQIGGQVTELPASYDSVATHDVRIPAGQHDVHLSYRFDNGLTVGVATPEGPWARASFVFTDGGPIRTVPPPWALRLAVWVLNTAGLVIALALLWAISSALRRHARWIGVAVGVAALSMIGGTFLGPNSPLLFAGLGLVLVQCWRLRGEPGLAGAALLTLLVMNTERVVAAVHGLDAIIFRRPGSDWLTYESFARDIFETGSLQGGEDLFFYQPGFRYLSVVLHSLLGDSDAVIGIVVAALLSWAIVLLLARAGKGSWTRPATAVVLSAGGAALLLLNIPETMTLVRIGVSEYPTWIVPPLLALCWFGPRRSARLLVSGALLVAFAFVVRTNQAPGLALAGLALLLARPKRKHVAYALAAGAIVVALLPLHNLVYGGEPRVLPTSGSLAGQTPVPIGDLSRAFTNDAVGDAVVNQLRILAFLPGDTYTPPPGHRLQIAFHLLQGLWLLALLRAIALRPLLPPAEALVILWPLAYLLPYLSFDARSAFPRHIVVAYISAAVAIIVVEGFAARRRAGPVARLEVVVSSPRELLRGLERAWRAGAADTETPAIRVK